MARTGVALIDPDGRLEPVSAALETAGIPIAGRYERVDAVETPPDCIVVLDAPATGSQGEVNGLTFLERALDRFDVPVVVYTIREGHDSIKAPLELGAKDVIRVPEHRPELIARRIESAAGYGGGFESSSAQLSSLLRNYPHTLFIKDELGRFANVTTQTAGNYGFTREEMIGMTDYELFETSHADELWEEEQQVIATDHSMVNEIEAYTDQTGSQRWVSTTKVPRHDADGSISGIVGGTQDVTPAKQQETLMAALHEASRELSRATTDSEIASVTVDIVTEIDYLPAVQVALSTGDGGLEPVETNESDPDRSIFDRYVTAFRRAHEDGTTYYVDTDGSVTADETAVVNAVFEGQFETEDIGIVIPLGGHGVLGLAAPDGSVDAFTDRVAHVLASNVTAAFDRAERERELERKNRQLEEFATLGAHELRNRLQIALAYVTHERQDNDSTNLAGTERTLERIDRLLNQLLQLARTSRIPQTTTATDIREAAQRAWTKITTDGATLSLPPARSLAANPDALSELFDFLFTNSVEHAGASNPASEAHDERAEAIDNGDDNLVSIEVGLLEDGFYVEDDGIGIPDEMKTDLFDVQYADTTAKSGYGLYIVSAIVEAHGWDVAVMDSESGGARFEITGVEWRDSAL